MKFALTSEQQDFGSSLEKLLVAEDTVGVARAWAAADFEPGRRLWSRLAEQGVMALLVPEGDGGMEAGHVELAIAMESVGRHALPGPYVESAALLSQVHDAEGRAAIAEGAMHTACTPQLQPFALDTDAAEAAWCVDPTSVTPLRAGETSQSIDPARRLQSCAEGDGSPSQAADSAVLACAAQLLGLGERLLEDSVAYVSQRKQFGRTIGSYQAIKHQLADVRIALDFARPLIFGAAVGPTPRATSAAKVGAADAAQQAMRVALQVHGAVGYTRELDLSLWLLKVRALQSAWGTTDFHRSRLAGLI